MFRYTICFVSMLTLAGNCFGQDCAAPGCTDGTCGNAAEVVKICVPEAKTAEVKGHCYEVTEKEICVPRFTLPWQKCTGPKCGYVIKVCVLKKKTTKSETCAYDWKIQEAEGCATGNCTTGNCAKGRTKLWKGYRCNNGTDCPSCAQDCASGCASAPEATSVQAAKSAPVQAAEVAPAQATESASIKAPKDATIQSKVLDRIAALKAAQLELLDETTRQHNAKVR